MISFRTRAALAIAAGSVGLLTASQAFAVDLLQPTDTVIAIDLDVAPTSNHPDAEGPANLLDTDPGTKYLNFAESGGTPGPVVNTAGPLFVPVHLSSPSSHPFAYI